MIDYVVVNSIIIILYSQSGNQSWEGESLFVDPEKYYEFFRSFRTNSGCRLYFSRTLFNDMRVSRDRSMIKVSDWTLVEWDWDPFRNSNFSMSCSDGFWGHIFRHRNFAIRGLTSLEPWNWRIKWLCHCNYESAADFWSLFSQTETFRP